VRIKGENLIARNPSSWLGETGAKQSAREMGTDGNQG
jgi:hypothetical protein